MDNKDTKNAFANSKLNLGDKYMKRHQDALKIERAKEFDDRISKFNKKEHTLEWAKEALVFCDREEKNGKDLMEFSKGLQDLPRIRQEAKDILSADERKKEEEKANKERLEALRLQELKKEKDRLKLLEEEEKLKSEKLEDEAVENMEKMIDNVSKASRDRMWLKNLENADLTLKGQSKKVYDRISNRFILESLKEEAKEVKLALDLDDEIIELNATRLKNKIWAEKIFNIEKKLNKKLDKYMKEKNTFFNMANLATKIYYGEELANIESIITKVENNDAINALDDYKKEKKQVEDLRNAIYIEEYIDNFEKRWKIASEQIEKLIKEAENKELERKKAEKAENERQALLAKKKAEKQTYGEQLASIENIITKVENNDAINALDDYKKIKKQVESLRKTIYIEEHIENFERRWKIASEQTEKLIKEEEKAEKAENERQALLAKRKAEKQTYGEQLASIENIITKVENNDAINALDDYKKIKKQVESLRKTIYIEEYIENFERRWKVASEEIERLIKEAEKAELERKKAEKEEEERQALLAQKKEEKKLRAKKRNKFLGSLLLKFIKILAVVALIAGIGGAMYYGIKNFNFDSILGKYILSIGSTVILSCIGIAQSFALGKSHDALRVFITTVINLAFFVVGIVGMFVPILDAFTIPCMACLILTSITHIIMIDQSKYGKYTDDNTFNLIWFNLGFIILAFGLLKLIPGIAGFITCAGTLILGSLSSFAAILMNLNDGTLYIIGALMMIVALIMVWFMNWNFYILAAGLFIAGLVYCFANEEFGEDFSPFTITVVIFGVIFFGITALITSFAV